MDCVRSMSYVGRRRFCEDFAMDNDQVSISLEFTPNPNTLKFVVNRKFMERGAANFTNVEQASHAPLAKKLFGVPGVLAVMIGTNFITITKAPDGDWDVL